MSEVHICLNKSKNQDHKRQQKQNSNIADNIFHDILIEVASKMAEQLDVSLDFLVGKTDVLIDSKVLNRIIEIQKLSADEQKTVFSLLDAFLRDTKTSQAYAS